MNLNECRIKELEQESAELKASVERFKSAINKVLDDPNTFRMYEHKELNDELCELIDSCPSHSLQEHDRQVILDAVDSVQKKTSATVVLSMVREYANSLTNGDNNG